MTFSVQVEPFGGCVIIDVYFKIWCPVVMYHFFEVYGQHNANLQTKVEHQSFHQMEANELICRATMTTLAFNELKKSKKCFIVHF